MYFYETLSVNYSVILNKTRYLNTGKFFYGTSSANDSVNLKRAVQIRNICPFTEHCS